MAIKKIDTRIQNKIDFLSNWRTNGIELLPGEIAFVKVIDQKTDETTGVTTHVPAVLLKVGESDENGQPKAFDALPWLSAKASDVYDWAKQPEKPSYTLEELGAEAAGAASSTISLHNTNNLAHADIRALVADLASQFDSYYTSTEIDQKLAAKADLVNGKIPASQLPTGFTGGSEGGSITVTNAVRYDEEQNLTEAEKDIARANIGATLVQFITWEEND